ncbi:hypothetical protein, variant [Fonticula alba]|uniref:Uncharacterized protein n=1 Tax=Fonticula alba TaxID=691883 RepID=A0A058Z460_FONAL|nr:hypothetical protein, variant [Fonticula alba]KCV69064.1 hypothetical protein, variant [Fonticula alba]|eukprot:XP_009496635.1 hypothetical protein, variant [Fonticula alba]
MARPTGAPGPLPLRPPGNIASFLTPSPLPKTDQTMVEVRIPLVNVDWCPAYVSENIRRMEAGRVNAAGELVVRSSTFAFQYPNYLACLRQIDQLVLAAAALPAPPATPRQERAAALREASNESRIRGKKHRSATKDARRS